MLLVPNAALRWKPQASQIDPAASKTEAFAESSGAAGTWPPLGRLGQAASSGHWRSPSGSATATMTEISGSDVEEGHAGRDRRGRARRGGRPGGRHDIGRRQNEQSLPAKTPKGSTTAAGTDVRPTPREPHMELIRLENIYKTYNLGRSRSPGAAGHFAVHSPRRDGGADGRLGLGQDHLDEHPRLPGPSHFGQVLVRRPGDERTYAKRAGAGADRRNSDSSSKTSTCSRGPRRCRTS